MFSLILRYMGQFRCLHVRFVGKYYPPITINFFIVSVSLQQRVGQII